MIDELFRRGGPHNSAIKEKGLFGIQHSTSRPRAKKWEHTVERLKQRFGITEDPD
tara:strand:- start:2095 stop:2259 length:165 start_codon:yes stop_codon:yes gene_type:complete